jgi:hypothetical protein
MIAFALACFITGVLLGMRFKVASLLPVMFGIAALTLSFGISSHRAVSFIVLAQLIAFVTVQFGYLAAAALAALSARRLYSPHGVTIHGPR